MAEEAPNTFAVIVKEVALLLRPIAAGMESPQDEGTVPPFLTLLLEQAGLTLDKALGAGSVETITTHLTTIATAYNSIATVIESGEIPELDDIPPIGRALASAFNALKALSALELQAYGPNDVLEDVEGIGQILLEFLLTDYLEANHYTLYNALVVFGVVDKGKSDANSLAGRINRVRLPFLIELLRDPEDAYKALLGWGTENFNPYRLLIPLAYLLHSLGFRAVLALPSEADAEALGWDGESEDGVDAQLRIPLVRDDSTVETEMGFALLPMRTVAGVPNGMALVPYGVGSSAQQIELGNQWQFDYRFDGNVTVRYGVVMDFDHTEIRALDEGGTLPADIEIKSLAAVRRTSEKGKHFQIFSQDGLGVVEAGTASLQVGFEFTDGNAAFFVELPLKDARLALKADDADGFLKKVLPDDGFEQTFDVTVGWSSKSGVYLRNGSEKSDFEAGRGFAGDGKSRSSTAAAARSLTGGGKDGFSTSVSVNANLLGIIQVDSVDLGVKPGDGKLVATAASTVAVTLGPITALVEKMGLAMEVSFPEEGANLGLLHLDFSFKPPAGAALKVDAAVVKGGGYLFFDTEKEQYAGILELTVAEKIALKAIGLITTRLPDGSSGFSLFVLITAEGFAPIQLGMGFTLNGVGGLLGVNRTVMTEVLRDGLRKGTLDSILFPKDPLKNAPTVISNLSAVFPPSRGRYLFGPMAILGWGTPTLISLKLAIILEIPDPIRLVLLGRLLVELPEPKHPIVRIQLDTVGELNFQKGTVTLDGVLFESRLLDFPLTGAMALRASWKDDPYFLLSIGGFNPRFPVPSGLPALERLALSLSSSESLRLRLEGYFALTSNTLQFGARFEVFAKVGALTLDAYLAFDTLIQFSPFGFIADIAAGATLKLSGKLLAALQLKLILSGPTPWHVRGSASIKVLFISYSVDIDYRFGPAIPPPPPEPTDVGALLRAALHHPNQWSSELPQGTAPLVALREAAVSGVVAHPLARVTVRQKVVPLNYAITRFGNSRPLNERNFQVQVIVNGTPVATPPTQVKEYFAVGQYRDLRDEEKLTRPSFDPLTAGYQFGSTDFDFDSAVGVEAAIGYETITLDHAVTTP